MNYLVVSLSPLDGTKRSHDVAGWTLLSGNFFSNRKVRGRSYEYGYTTITGHLALAQCFSTGGLLLYHLWGGTARHTHLFCVKGPKLKSFATNLYLWENILQKSQRQYKKSWDRKYIFNIFLEKKTSLLRYFQISAINF